MIFDSTTQLIILLSLYVIFLFLVFDNQFNMDDILKHAMPAFGAAFGMFALGFCNDKLPELTGLDWLSFSSSHLAAVAATLWFMPEHKMSQPKTVVGAHFIMAMTSFMVGQSGMFGDFADT